MTPLVVTARLVNGVAASDPWTPTIDGILAYWAMLERLGPESFALGQALSDLPPVDGLPLEIIHHGAPWWYACSLPLYREVAQAVRPYSRRFDRQMAEKHLLYGKSGRVETKAGPYKEARLSVLQRITPSISWHVIGEGEEIRRLLRRCHWIGKYRSSGFGEVSAWFVETGGDPEIARHHRPLPVEYATLVGIDGITMPAGYRPPIHSPRNQTMCVLPMAGR